MNISAYGLSVELRVSPPTVNDIVREKRGITPEMAARLAKYFGTSEQFWLNLQDAFAVHHFSTVPCSFRALSERAGS
jgi:addiction module HigA family antidote